LRQEQAQTARPCGLSVRHVHPTCPPDVSVRDVRTPCPHGMFRSLRFSVIVYTPPSVTLDDVAQLEFRYPDTGNNAETLMVDPRNGDIYVVGKSGSGRSPVYRASPPFVPFDRVPMELVTTLQFGTAPLEGRTETTAGEFSPSGDLIAIRTYDAIHLWRRPPGRTVEEAFASEPCDAPQVDEPQGEAICLDAISGGYFTLSEGRGQQLYYFAPR
jgi:hypothetical protein